MISHDHDSIDHSIDHSINRIMIMPSSSCNSTVHRHHTAEDHYCYQEGSRRREEEEEEVEWSIPPGPSSSPFHLFFLFSASQSFLVAVVVLSCTMAHHNDDGPVLLPHLARQKWFVLVRAECWVYERFRNDKEWVLFSCFQRLLLCPPIGDWLSATHPATCKTAICPKRMGGPL